MPPDILMPLTPDDYKWHAPLLVFDEVVAATGFDPDEPWAPCECPGRDTRIHDENCWLDWIELPNWMTSTTQVLPVVEECRLCADKEECQNE